MLLHVTFDRFGVVLAVAALSLSGCSSSTADKAQSQAPTSPAASLSQQPSKAKPATAIPQGQASSSSLDEHRQGVALKSGPLKEIFFAFDESELSEQARATLRENATWLGGNPSAKIEIEGHCDERGTTEYNIALGAKRAAAARDYLLSLGVAAARISTTSFGEELAICKESTEDCYQKNRRDRFVVLRGGPAF